MPVPTIIRIGREKGLSGGSVAASLRDFFRVGSGAGRGGRERSLRRLNAKPEGPANFVIDFGVFVNPGEQLGARAKGKNGNQGSRMVVGRERGLNASSQWTWGNGVAMPSLEYCEKFYNRTADLINQFHPDLLYFDDTFLPLFPVSDAGLKIAAHFYNSNMARHKGRLEAVLLGKVLTEEQKKSLVWDVERGAPDQIQTKAWQTCTCIGEWHYKNSIYDNNGYRSSREVIHSLVDMVSKNGNLLLNIPVRGDGSIDEKEIAILENIAAWMDINKESIFDTRPWIVFGEGPSAEMKNPITAQGFNEGKIKFSAKDIRFNAKGKVLYATVMGTPLEAVVIKNLGAATSPNQIKSIKLLGSKEPVKWTQHNDHLKVEKPAVFPNEIALVYKITLR